MQLFVEGGGNLMEGEEVFEGGGEDVVDAVCNGFIEVRDDFDN